MRVLGLVLLFLAIAGAGLFVLNSTDERTALLWERPREEAAEKEVNTLILGRIAEGQGGIWHAAPKLTDAIVVVHYNPESGVINLISLPRDLYGEFGGEEFKINEMYQREKIKEFMEKLPEIIGIKVKDFIIVDAEIIKASVDELGGIDVETKKTVTDSVSGYQLEAGVHHLNGEDVIWLMRNRQSPEGDFFREKNQHTVIESIFNKLNSLSTVQKTSFLLKMVPYAQEAEKNFSIGELVPRLGKFDRAGFNSITLDFSTGLLESSYVPINASSSEYVLLPKEGINEYSAIREFVTEKLR